MLLYVVRRLMLLGPTLLGVLAVVFFVMAFAPGGFGGVELGAEGQQTQGVDAQRIRKRLERRYGLDLPTPVQFGRWLNQISPVGFRMSSDITFDETTRAAVVRELASLPLNTRPRNLDRAVAVALGMAAYRDEPAVEVARELADKLANPVDAMVFFNVMDVPLGEASAHALRDQLHDLRQRDDGLARAQNMLLDELAFEMSGISRIRFDRPALKVPDLGESLRGRRISELLMERAPITVLLNAISIPIIYLVAIFSGLYAARHRGSWFDLGTGFTLVGLWSVPVIWAGVMMIHYLASEQYLHWFPPTGLHDLRADQMPFLPQWTDGGFQRGWLLDALWHMVLPVVCLTYTGFAVMSKVMRGSILDTLSADYVRTARAKGVSETVVLWRHVFRNALLPLITMFAGILPSLFVGAVVVETIFSINGMGRLAVDAAFQKDRELVMATTLLAGLLGLVSELVRDICYAIADPRVSYE